MPKISELPAINSGSLDGSETVPVVKDGINYRATLSDAIFTAAPAASPFTGGRGLYGIIHTPFPAMSLNASLNEAIFTDDGRGFSIPAGVGNTYYVNFLSAYFDYSALEEGDLLTVFLEMTPGTGSFNPPAIDPNPGSNIVFSQRGTNLWVADIPVPAGGLTGATFSLVSSDAANVVEGRVLRYAVRKAGADDSFRQKDSHALDTWIATAMLAEGLGNLWPREHQDIPITAGDASERHLQYGIAAENGETLFGMFYAEADDGSPIILDRLYLQVPGGAAAHLESVADHPGVFAGYMRVADAALAANDYVGVYLDNAQSVAGGYTQKPGRLKKAQLYRTPPAVFGDTSRRLYRNEGKVLFENFDGQQQIGVPLFADEGDKVMIFDNHRYDTTNLASANTIPGGVGSSWRDTHYARLSGFDTMQPIYSTRDGGQNEPAIKLAGLPHVGGFVHGGQRRLQAPVLEVDGSTVSDPDIRRNFGWVEQVKWTEQTELLRYDNPTSAIANLTTVKTWTAVAGLSIAHQLDWLQLLDLEEVYGFMWSHDDYVNG